MKKSIFALLPLALVSLFFATPAAHAWPHKSLEIYRVGSSTDKVTPTDAGYLLMGGGVDLDEAFTTLCTKAHGGDVVILRSHGGDDYNPYINGLCKLNSVTTLVIRSRQAAERPVVSETIRHAEAIFIAGGDQSEYIRFWKGTPVQAEVNEALHRGVPIGGTSAGLAVLGEYIFTAMHDTAVTAKVLPDPFHKTVTLERTFLDIPLLRGTITDTHFDTRDRMGRLMVFMARILASDGMPQLHAIAVDEKGAVDLEPDGSAHVVGTRAAYFLTAHPPAKIAPKEPLNFGPVEVYRLLKYGSFDVKSWQGTGGEGYELTAKDGRITSSQSGGSEY